MAHNILKTKCSVFEIKYTIYTQKQVKYGKLMMFQYKLGLK